ncbi:HAD-IC family P-type ATPase [Candidatus Uhrbacteria bacterium]|nr:HAD-IC family P-type ATPase [Candidatus Uhrbacteria bacterium]
MSGHSWHQLSLPSVFQALGSAPEGLSQNEVRDRKRHYGPNQLPQKNTVGWMRVLLAQFASPLILILLVAVGVSFTLGEAVDAWVIVAAVILNTMVGFAQEYKANQSLEHLRSLIEPRAMVLREGCEQEIDARALVPGDVLVLQTGDQVAADARLIEAIELHVNEAALTGESLPQQKHIDPLHAEVPVGDRTNMVFAGSSVVAGRGRALVVATGAATELGSIATLVDKTPETVTPLQQQLSQLARWIVLLILFLVVVLFVLGIVSGRTPVEMYTLSVALAVAAIPEGLAVSVTIILAIGMQRILKRKSLVRKLVAAETLGSVSIICTDKTGTITEGEMRVTHVATAEGAYTIGSLPESSKTIDSMLTLLALCNDAILSSNGDSRGTPTERALLESYVNLRADRASLLLQHPRVAEVPFDSAKKFMVTAHAWDGKTRLLLKGASGAVLSRCSKMELAGEIVALTADRLAALTQQELTLTRQGLRLVALAQKDRPGRVEKISTDVQSDFVFLGFVGLHDPLRASVKDQIAAAARAGVRTIMITGDHPETARAIGAQAGLVAGAQSVVTGVELDAWSDEEFTQRVGDITIYARVEPRHKIRIVNAWVARGEVVAMIGDGVNDAPALKAADIGIAVESGTEVAKQSADLVILDNNLGTITAAIEEGRVIFDNIRKTTAYLLADSFTEIVLIGGSLILGLPVPLLPIHILWINLVADSFPSIGLTLEPGEKDVMRLPPRPRNEPVMNQEMLTIIFLIGVTTDLILFAAYLWLLHSGESIALIRSVMFAAVGIDSLLYIFSMKSFRRTIFRINPFSNPWMLAGVGIGFALMGVALLHPFFESVFHLVPLTASAWGFMVLLSLVKLGAIECTKEFFLFRRSEL